MSLANLKLETLTCPSCLQKITNALKRLDGVNKNSIEVLFNSSRVKLEFNEEVVNIDVIKLAITNLGYDVLQASVK